VKGEYLMERLVDATEIDGLMAVDRESFSQPWTRQMYEDELRNPCSTIWIARRPDGHLAGYCSVWLVVDELHINNVAVCQDLRRHGLGAALVAHALTSGAAAGAKSATLEVRRSNTAARRLYEQLGFRQRGERARYYDQPVDDALILWAEIQGIGATSST
jgi:ribosomal-protein-alanine N-acetyltransferase